MQVPLCIFCSQIRGPSRFEVQAPKVLVFGLQISPIVWSYWYSDKRFGNETGSSSKYPVFWPISEFSAFGIHYMHHAISENSKFGTKVKQRFE